MAGGVLYVGDVHARPDSVEEVWKLIQYIQRVASENAVDYICFLGDQFHTHSVIHLSVMALWRDAFAELSQYMVYALVGNHDMSGKYRDKNHSMMLYNPAHVTVVTEPMSAPWGPFLIPYQADKAEFIRIAQGSPEAEQLVCHQTFDGSKYENGFFAQDGIDPNLIPQKSVISGHIHTPQQIGKVWYPGSPRWQSVSDANTDRAIWVVEPDGTKKAFDTKTVCKPIYCLVDHPGEPVTVPEGLADVIVDVYGDQEHVRRRAAELEKSGARVRQFPTLQRVAKVKESDGLPASLRKYVEQLKPKNGTPNDVLLKMAEQRISWMRAEG